VKKHNRLSQAAHLAKKKRAQNRRRKEREVRFPKPTLVPRTEPVPIRPGKTDRDGGDAEPPASRDDSQSGRDRPGSPR